jgi:myosin-crossreactive antigen
MVVYNQYDSIMVPLQDWLRANVDVRFGMTFWDAIAGKAPDFRPACYFLRKCQRE